MFFFCYGYSVNFSIRSQNTFEIDIPAIYFSQKSLKRIQIFDFWAPKWTVNCSKKCLTIVGAHFLSCKRLCYLVKKLKSNFFCYGKIVHNLPQREGHPFVPVNCFSRNLRKSVLSHQRFIVWKFWRVISEVPPAATTTNTCTHTQGYVCIPKSNAGQFYVKASQQILTWRNSLDGK